MHDASWQTARDDPGVVLLPSQTKATVVSVAAVRCQGLPITSTWAYSVPAHIMHVGNTSIGCGEAPTTTKVPLAPRPPTSCELVRGAFPHRLYRYAKPLVSSRLA